VSVPSPLCWPSFLTQSLVRRFGARYVLRTTHLDFHISFSSPSRTSRNTSMRLDFSCSHATHPASRYYYWFAFPALVAKPAWEIEDHGWVEAESTVGVEAVSTSLANAKGCHSSPSSWRPSTRRCKRRHHNCLTSSLARPLTLPLTRSPPSQNTRHSLQMSHRTRCVSKSTVLFTSSDSRKQRIISFLDPSAHAQNPGWPLRNLLAYLRFHHPTSTRTLRILSWRDTEAPSAGKNWRSRLGIVSIGEASADHVPETRPAAVGWEKNAQGKLGPRVADLGGMMDPSR
jgi:ubiquitin-like modifier-activating enzyme ATG7